MPCYKPLKAWRTYEKTSNGKNKIAFGSPEGAATPIQLPCGTCIGCKLDRSLSWAIRCIHESQTHNQNSFITLTYAPEHLPTDGSLLHTHFQIFIRELRRQHPSHTIRYYMCGEYGEKLSRPHYHACLFGIDFPDKVIWNENEGILTYTSDILQNIWGRGHCTVGELNFHTAAYTARYITKKITGNQAEEHYTTTCSVTGNIIHLASEYNTMSRRPGIAYKWFEKYHTDVYPSDFLIHNGAKVKVPRYYDNQIPEELLEKQKLKRKKNARKLIKENTPERLATREKCKQLKYKQLTRNYENET